MISKGVVKTIIKKCLGHKNGEELLIVCDDKLCELAYDFYKEAKNLGVETSCLLIKPRKAHGEEPPKIVAESLKKADIALLLTSVSLSHTKARKIASKRFKTRIASLPGATRQMLARAIPIDYSSLQKKTNKLAKLLTKGRRIEVTTKKGTHIIMDIEGRRGFTDNGIYTKAGSFGNLPAGEACIGPLEHTANGRLVVDGSMPLIGRIKKPMEIVIKNGYAKNIPISGVKDLLNSFGSNVLSVAELGIGLNPKAKITGNVLEDEKTYNTAHIAFGNNKSFGGKVHCPSHLDFVFLRPTIIIDGIELNTEKL